MLAACGGGPAATNNPSAAATPASIESLLAKSKTEKGIVMYGNGPASYFKPVVDGFKAAYPGISFEYTSFSDNVVFSKYQSENAQGAAQPTSSSRARPRSGSRPRPTASSPTSLRRACRSSQAMRCRRRACT